jgi:hypothetical protein
VQRAPGIPHALQGAENKYKPRVHRAAGRERVSGLVSLLEKLVCVGRNREALPWNPDALSTRRVLNYCNELRIFSDEPGGTEN